MAPYKVLKDFDRPSNCVLQALKKSLKAFERPLNGSERPSKTASKGLSKAFASPFKGLKGFWQAFGSLLQAFKNVVERPLTNPQNAFNKPLQGPLKAYMRPLKGHLWQILKYLAKTFKRFWRVNLKAFTSLLQAFTSLLWAFKFLEKAVFRRPLKRFVQACPSILKAFKMLLKACKRLRKGLQYAF